LLKNKELKEQVASLEVNSKSSSRGGRKMSLSANGREEGLRGKALIKCIPFQVTQLDL